MKQEAISCLTWMMNRVSQTVVYTNWSDKFKAEEIKDASDKLYRELGKHIDVSRLTLDEAKELGFCKWSDDHPGLYLFPLWIVPLIPDGMTVYNLDGEPHVYHKDNSDNDTRFGCVAYGVIFEESTGNPES